MTFSYKSLTPEFAVAPQLSATDMQSVAEAGFRSVIINRPDGEGGPGQPCSDDVLQAAKAHGLQAFYQPVISGSITAGDIDRFCRFLKELPAPVLAYCRTGARCTTLYQEAMKHEQDQDRG